MTSTALSPQVLEAEATALAAKDIGVIDLVVKDLGLLDYRAAWNVQLAAHAAVAEGKAPPTLLLVEHPPVITFGRKGGRANLLADPAFLEREGFSLYDIERGGDVTYHGPGQLVGYPILPIGRMVRSYLRNLEAVMVQVLAEYGLHGKGSPGYAGVWVGEEKVVAIGVAIKRNVSFHGFAFNVATDLNHFSYIVPCGIQDKGVTSLSKLLGYDATLAEVKPKLTHAFAKTFQMDILESSQPESEVTR